MYIYDIFSVCESAHRAHRACCLSFYLKSLEKFLDFLSYSKQYKSYTETHENELRVKSTSKFL